MCEPCAAGTFQNSTGKKSCHPCQAGTYADNTGFKKCIVCPFRLSSFNDGSTSCSICDKSFYLDDSVPLANISSLIFKSPSTFCLSCPTGSSCNSTNASLTKLEVSSGFWRHSNLTSRLYKCLNSNICIGTSTISSATDRSLDTEYLNDGCKHGHTGPLCEVCTLNNYHFSFTDKECVQCPSRTNIVLQALLVVIVTVLIIMLLTRQFMKRRINTILVVIPALSLQAKAKLLISFYQIISSFQEVYGVTLSGNLKNALNILDYFTLDFLKIIGVPVDCIGSVTQQLIIKALWPYLIVIMGLFVWIVYQTLLVVSIRRECTPDFKQELFKNLKQRSLQAIIVVFYFALPTVSRSIFDAIKCRAFQDTDDVPPWFVSYLIIDMNVVCNHSNTLFRTINVIFWIFFTIWIVLTPLAFLMLLWYISSSIRSNEITSLANDCRFLWEDYDSSMWFWDIVDTYRKVFLTGIIMFIDFQEGSNKLLRLVVAIIVATLFFGVLLAFRPYKRSDDFYFSLVTNFMLITCLSLGVVLKLCNDEDVTDGGSYVNLFNGTCEQFIARSIDSFKASILVVTIASAATLIAIGLIISLAVNKIKEPVVRMVSTGYTPNLELSEGHKTHAFMSHVWSTGQARTHSIVRKMQLLMPGFKVWLDVDDLEDMSKLEQSVEETSVFILFYSKNYFMSRNCRREIYAAYRFEKPVVVVYEGNDLVIDEMQDECKRYCEGDGITEPSSSQILQMLLKENYNDDEDKLPIQWLNEGSFSAATLGRIYLSVLKYFPYYQKNSNELEKGIKVPGELGEVSFQSDVEIVLYERNTGCLEIAQELISNCTIDNATISIVDASNYFNKVKRQVVEKKEYDLMKESGDFTAPKPYFLFYLNEYTFIGDDHETKELIQVLISCLEDPDIELILVHERDSSKGGCDFGEFFKQAPPVLINGDPYFIFKSIAVPIYSIKEYRIVSLREIASKMGAILIGNNKK